MHKHIHQFLPASWLFLSLGISRPLLAAEIAGGGGPYFNSTNGWPALAQTWTQLRRLPVTDTQGSRVGRLEGVLLQPGSHRIVSALVAPADVYGGFQVPVPVSLLTGTQTRIQLAGSQTNLLAAPKLSIETAEPAAIARAVNAARGYFLGPAGTNQADPGPLIPSPRLLGKSVTNPAGEELGSVVDFTIDLARGRIFFVLISLDATGQHQYAVPPEALLIEPGRPTLMVNVSRARIAAEAAAGRFLQPQMHDPAWAARTYRQYGVMPDFAPDPGPAAEGGGDLFPLNAGSHVSIRIVKPAGQVDDALTRAVVTAWVEAGLAADLSAYHTRILVEGGKVKLRGGARDETQKRQLRLLAEQVAGAANVDDQLVVGN